MQKKIFYLVLGWLILIGWQNTYAQTDTLCNPKELDKYVGELYFNYGSATDVTSSANRSNFILGQPLITVQNLYANSYIGEFGFFSQWFVPPLPPAIIVSQGDFKDRIKINWEVDPLSTPATGFRLSRDGSFLAEFDGESFEFLDFNVQAGEFYEYSIVAKNGFGSGIANKAVGFVNPNGVITGKVESNSGNPVPNVEVYLTPKTGSSMLFDGIDDELCVNYSSEFPTDKFTVSTYVKLGKVNDEATIIDWGSSLKKNWWITTTKANEPKGYVFHIGNGTGSDSLKYYLPNLITNEENVNDWHQITMVFNGSAMSAMVDGQFVGTKPAVIARAKNYLSIGSKIGAGGHFSGHIDDIRVYNRHLTQTEVNNTKNRAVAKSEKGLVCYWKMDEGVGLRVFDNASSLQNGKIIGASNATVSGAAFTTERPEVYNAGVTDLSGYYVIDGINYSTTESFRARAVKNFEFNSALEFNAADKSYGNLTDYDMPDTSTIQLLFHPFDLKTRQTILSKRNLYEAYIDNNTLFLDLGGKVTELGTIKSKYYHLAVTLNNRAGIAEIYLENEPKKTVLYTGTSNWKNGTPWYLGTNDSTAAVGKFYTGLIDEFAIFKSALPANVIQLHKNIGIQNDTTRKTMSLLYSHFDLNEASGTDVYDYLAVNYGELDPRAGKILRGASWSNNARIKETKPHEFEPNERVVNINTSNTAVGNVDFKAVSTINVSGGVRFDNTFCFADSVDILVNDQANIPPIRTNKKGMWSADFEPGRTIKLSAKYKDHVFGPAFFELRKLQAPKAGITFLDKTSRTIRGRVAGNEKCRKSIIPKDSRVVIKVESNDGCFIRTDTIRNTDGKFEIKNLPARALTVSVVEHSDPEIYSYFQTRGGQNVDLRDITADTTDFIYVSPPIVEVEDIAMNKCTLRTVGQGVPSQIKVKVFEQYSTFVDDKGKIIEDGKCYVDNAEITIDDPSTGITTDTTLAEGVYTYQHKFTPKNVTILPPYLTTMTITGTVNSAVDTKTTSFIVLGAKPRPGTFTSSTPEMPSIVLRDPPGDASYAVLEQGSTYCSSTSVTWSKGINQDAEQVVSIGGTSSIGVGKEIQTTNKASVIVTGGGNQSWDNTTTQQTCITTTQVISTSPNDAVVGSKAGGDVYVGITENVQYGGADVLNIDMTTCKLSVKTKLTINDIRLKGTFVYSEKFVIEDVIPSLKLLASQPLSKNPNREKDSIAVILWQQFIQKNQEDKGDKLKTISFDSGAIYDEIYQSEKTEETTKVFNDGGYWSAGFSTELDFLGGFETGFAFTHTINKTEEDFNSNTANTVITYHLEDDDSGDNFLVNVHKGNYWQTGYIFDLVAGESMCPWEEGTRHRSAPELKVDGNTKSNIPANTSAVYQLTLGNDSPTQEEMEYALQLVTGTNPSGAILKVDGQPLTQPVRYTIPFGETIVVTLTLDKGPIDFNYKDIQIKMFSECESNDSLFAQYLTLNASFIEPCSPVDIGFPLQGFVVTPGVGNKLSVTLNEYNKDDKDLKQINFQYRRTGGDGDWQPVKTVLKEELDNVFTNITWDTGDLKDGLYEIRAVAICSNENLKPGISTIIKGEISRTPPEVVGIPQPSDGTWDPGDEISITFDESIDCDKIFQAENIGGRIINNTIGLYDATTNELIGSKFTCVGNKIVILPLIDPVTPYENRTFRVVVSGKDYDDAMLQEKPSHVIAAIRDKAGNRISKTIDWEFAVNQNNLEWIGPDIIEVNEVLKPFTVKRQVRNRGGSIASFRMEDVPSWLTVTPSTGTLNPGQSADVTFTFQEDLLIGDYAATLKMVGSRGEEPLGIDYRVRCPQPSYVVDNPSEYESSMNIVTRLSIFDKFSMDPSDVIVAKIDGKIRGVGKVSYYRNIPPADPTPDPITKKPTDESNRWLVFMTVFGDESDNDKPIEFRVWDGDKCNEYVEVINKINFQTGALVGTPIYPDTVKVINVVKKCIPLNRGWNWVSFNLDLPEGNTVSNVLASLKLKSGAIIKSEDLSAKYYANPINNWLGSLKTVNPQSRYMINVSQRDTVCIKGSPYLSEEFPITINPGWNWVGYVPSTGMTVSQALRGLTPLDGDLIKSQTLFAQYVNGYGWIGNLNFLEPLKGYLLKISNSGTLVYPTGTTNTNGPNNLDDNTEGEISPKALAAQAAQEAPMTFDFTKYQLTMNLIGKVKGMAIDADDELRAYINGQLVGVNKSISHADNRLFFQTIYFEDETNISFKLYKADRKKEYNLNRTIPFKSETLAGLVEDPIVFDLEMANLVPITIDIKDQLIWQPSKIFPTVSIPSAVSGQSTACGLFTFNSVLPMGTDTKPLCIAQTGLSDNMTGVMKINYNERSTFVSGNDVLSFINPATRQTVGCGTFDSQYGIFNINIKGGLTETPIDVVYYSNAMKKSFTVKSGVMYRSNRELGDYLSPAPMDVSPLSITNNNGVITAVLRDTSWTGKYCIDAFALNCPNFGDGQTTFCFQRMKQGACLDIVVRNVTEGNNDVVKAVSISSQVIVNSGVRLEYKGGNKIELKPGFETKSGTVFTGKIEGCSN